MKLFRQLHTFRDGTSLDKVEGVFFDFDGVFTNNTVIVDELGREAVVCSRLDGLGLSAVKAVGVAVEIISTEANPVVTRRAEKLGINASQDVKNKAETLLMRSAALEIRPERSIFVGNDINDSQALQLAGLGIGVADSHPSIFNLIDGITALSGGTGAVREICDWIVDLKLGGGR